MEYKRIMNMNAGSPLRARLEYQNECHYEPLVDRAGRQPLVAVKRDPPVNIAETLKEEAPRLHDLTGERQLLQQAP